MATRHRLIAVCLALLIPLGCASAPDKPQMAATPPAPSAPQAEAAVGTETTLEARIERRSGKGKKSGSINLWNVKKRKTDSAVDVIIIGFKPSVDLAFMAAQDAFGDDVVQVADDFQSVEVFTQRQWEQRMSRVEYLERRARLEDRRALSRDDNGSPLERLKQRTRLPKPSVTIEPIRMKNKAHPDESGITYRIISYNSYSKRQAAALFNEALDDNLRHTNYPLAYYPSAVISWEKGVVEMAPDAIPITYAGFRNYLDRKQSLQEFEGIWDAPTRRLTLGLYYRPNDIRYHYHAVVLDSPSPRWRPGEVVAKFTRLTKGELLPAIFKQADKTDEAVTVEVDTNLLSVASQGSKVALIKSHPHHGETNPVFRGLGTGWAIDERGTFITNAHVVQNADKIYVGYKDDEPLRARLLILDERLDLAVVRIKKPTRRYLPIPLTNARKAVNGTDIVAIGFPKAFQLGDRPRITEGIISAQAGFNNDVTRYQVSAAINPGNSGGPVVGPQGSVVGVVVSGMKSLENSSFIIKSGYVRTLLDQVDVNYRTDDSEQPLTAEEIFRRYGDSVLPVWTE